MIDILSVVILCFIMMIVSVLKGIFLAYPLLLGLFFFCLLSIKRGFNYKNIIAMLYEGGLKTIPVIKIFVLIGAITSLWIASGTVPALVYYGILYINKNLFLMFTFILCGVMSMLLGTSFGTVGTAGVALMVMGRIGLVNPYFIGGAILSGAYLGDRMSPLSSSANLVATITKTNLYYNIRNMIKTSIVPIFLTCFLYGIISYFYPLKNTNSIFLSELHKFFYIRPLVFIPAFILILLCLLKVDVKITMALSAVAAFIIAYFYQKYSFIKLINIGFFGYSDTRSKALTSILKGGGILSMLKVSILVFISSSYTGIIEKTGILKELIEFLKRSNHRKKPFLMTLIISIFSAAFGCTQVMAIILTDLIIKDVFNGEIIDKNKRALYLENSAVLVSPLVPWNIAVLVPLTTLKVGFLAIPFSFYLILVPLWYCIFLERNII